MAGGRQAGNGRGRRGAAALRHLYGDERRAVGGARLDDVLLVRHHRHAAGVSLLPYRPRIMGLGQCAGAARHGFPPRRHGVHDHRLWPPCLGLGRAIRARQNGPADLARRRHGCARPRQYRDPLQADHRAVHAVLRAASRAHLASARHRSAQNRGAHAVRCRRARHEHRRHPRAHPGFMGRAAGGILRLHRSLAPCRRFFLPAFANARRAGDHASPRRRAGLGNHRSADAKAATRRRARPHRVHEPEFRILAAIALPGRRLRHLRSQPLPVRAHPSCAPSARSPAAPTI